MTILVDDPIWSAHGRRWAHLVSDSDLEELAASVDREELIVAELSCDVLETVRQRMEVFSHRRSDLYDRRRG